MMIFTRRIALSLNHIGRMTFCLRHFVLRIMASSLLVLTSAGVVVMAAPLTNAGWSSSECVVVNGKCVPGSSVGTKKFYPGFYALYGSDGSGVDSVDISDIAGKNQYVGIARVYRWKTLEPTFGNYNFSQIDSDKAIAKATGRKLGIYLRTDNIVPGGSPVTPSYMWNDSSYGGLVAGRYGNYYASSSNDVLAAVLWNSKVKARLNSLLGALASKYNADPDIAFVIFVEETHHGANTADDPNWSCGLEMQTIKDIFTHAWSVFPNTPTLLELDWGCADIPSNFHQFVINGGHGAWSINTRPSTQEIDDAAYSLYRNNYNQIAGLVFLDGWNDINDWPNYQTTDELLAQLGPGKALQPRYFLVDHTNSPNQALINKAIDDWWVQHGKKWPLDQRPTGW